MRETCQSGSMSGNRKQNQVKPDCGDEVKTESHTHRELPSLRLFSTLLAVAIKISVGRSMSQVGCLNFHVAIAETGLSERSATSRDRQNLGFPVHLFSGEGFVSRRGCRGRLD
jgi:hypothetical protein